MARTCGPGAAVVGKAAGGSVRGLAKLRSGITEFAALSRAVRAGRSKAFGGQRTGSDGTGEPCVARGRLPGLGRCGYDPTHRCAVDGRHIAVAIGRDYADVPPLRGVYRNGGGESVMTVDLRVEFTNNGRATGASPGGQSQ